MTCTRLVVDGHPLLALVLLVLLAGRESAPAAEADRLTLPAVIAEALEKNPEIQALQRRFEAARARVPQARALPDPTIAIAPETAIGGRLGTIEYTLAQQLPWLFTKPKYDAQVREAEAQIGASKASLEALRNRTLFEVSDLLTKLQTAERQATLYQTSVLPLAEQTLHAATIGYQTGKVDFLTLLESQRTLRDVELGLYQGLVAMQQRRAELELALGMELP
jgi:outer membrane protein TolC